jgi:RND superfamily putative drug exporter
VTHEARSPSALIGYIGSPNPAHFPEGCDVLARIALLAIAAPRRIIASAILLSVGATVFGIPVAKSLSAGGFQDPTSPSAHASQVLADKFRHSDQQLLILVTDPADVNSTAARTVGVDIADRLKKSPHVLDVTSAWTAPPPQAAAQLVTEDTKSGLIIATLDGGENDAQKYADELSNELVEDRDGVTVRAGGTAMAYAQVNHQTQRDVLVMELIAIPLSFLVLVWVFGGLLAAMLPIAISGMAIVGGMSLLRLITYATDVSIFALNLTTAIGLALAIDYTLLIISRYREEIANGADRDSALIHTMTTAGRAVVFSAITVALSLSAMILFPMYFLKSFAYAGITTVAFVAVAAIVVTPAGIVLLGLRLDALDVRRLARRLLRRPEPETKPVEQLFWYRSTMFVVRRAVPVGLAVIAFLLFLGTPFLDVKWGYPDDRVLPPSASSRQVGDVLRNDFASDSSTQVEVLVPDADRLDPVDLERYAADLSRVADVSAVAAPTGTFVGGNKVGPPSGATGAAGGSAFLTVSSTAPLFTERSDQQLDALHAVAGPGGRGVEMTGSAPANRDSVEAITSRVPLVLGLIAVITFVLLFLLTGSVAIPLKALLLNALSLTAAFGALVWIFQEGHLGALGTTSTGTLVAHIPLLLFCIAFGLSMDYEVFLVSRIREYWLMSDQTDADNDESVALGLARTGRVVTAAALVMSISFAALIAANVSFMRMFGLGLALAVLVDATLVRMMLLPAFMHVLGKWNWWAPRPLARLHARIGISEAGGHVGQQTPRNAKNPT